MKDSNNFLKFDIKCEVRRFNTNLIYIVNPLIQSKINVLKAI